MLFYLRGLPANFLLPAACLFLPPKEIACSVKEKHYM